MASIVPGGCAINVTQETAISARTSLAVGV